jgi:hypothetical protein
MLLASLLLFNRLDSLSLQFLKVVEHFLHSFSWMPDPIDYLAGDAQRLARPV